MAPFTVVIETPRHIIAKYFFDEEIQSVSPEKNTSAGDDFPLMILE